MPTVGLHTLHYARSPFYCNVRFGSQTVESARVSLLTECGPCSPARSPGTGVARNPTLQRRRPFSFECRRSESDVEYTLRVANPDGMPKGSCTLAAPPEADAVYARRPRQSAEGSRNQASSPAPSATSRLPHSILSTPTCRRVGSPVPTCGPQAASVPCQEPRRTSPGATMRSTRTIPRRHTRLETFIQSMTWPHSCSLYLLHHARSGPSRSRVAHRLTSRYLGSRGPGPPRGHAHPPLPAPRAHP
jgi:hypothetical protein